MTLLTLGYSPYGLFAGLYIASVSYVVAGTLFFYEYYRSRFLLHAHRSQLFGIVGLLLLSINYFTNAGIEGSTDLIWPVYLLLLLTICPYKHMVAWITLFILVFGLIHVVELQYPQLIHYPFRAVDGQFLDRITAFPIPVISIAIIIGFLRRSYDKERAMVAQRDAEKSRLFSILSHDIRAPFIQIQHYCALLNNPTVSTIDRAQIEQELKRRNDQTLDMITNLLYWSRSQLDGFSVHLAPLFLAETLESTLSAANELGHEKGIALDTSVHANIRVLADANMLQLVVRNLLQNAIKFTEAGGLIRVEADTTKDSCCLIIHDNGSGIAAEQMERIFFGAVPTFGTSNEKGVGLGLQLCKEFMERQGGDIYAESTPKKGSRFTIVIPLV
ncbi:HAMP domain-containing histidine kinase [Sphingobacterium sp. SGG-5]|uniref:sensor histidine kinase n=1 Tax=Sphingobacterium sp. SGG-5 TaxID=2710881 RepID=UPI0013EB7869|nr:HAMP domain-containing sensor histidine kinase [Sphingobacterium sp. SGG-5]NGM63402.1 HAMP domain-containing histidine kinase [Sphingobacterium sp. SGG-5]